MDYDSGLLAIDNILHCRGATLASFSLPVPQEGPLTEIEHEDFFLNSQAHTMSLLAHHGYHCLNDDQQNIFKAIVQATNDTESLRPRIYFVEGAAGGGKTFLMNTIIQQLRGNKQIVLVVGTTALSVTLYDSSRTAHSLFGIPITEVSLYYSFNSYI